MKFLKHASEQPFVLATGMAALIHSTWALATFFGGEIPTWEPANYKFWAELIYLLIPAFMIAFALDIGQISTSAEIRAGDHSAQKYITFVVFALATYYLQWLYMAHHMPALELGSGVYTDGLAGQIVLMMRNAAIWFIPSLLPLSTTMYTLSGAPRTAPAPLPPSTAIEPVEPITVEREREHYPNWLDEVVSQALEHETEDTEPVNFTQPPQYPNGNGRRKKSVT